MAFEPKTWQDGADGGTPITAAELNRLETGIVDVEGIATAIENNKPAWDDVTGKPAAFPPADHAHSASDIGSGTLAAARIPTLAQSKVTGLTSALEGKAEAYALEALATRVGELESKVEALENPDA